MRLLMALALASVLAGQTAEKMLEAARHKEVMAGDLKGAIAEYRKIAAKFAGRAEVAAQALVKMGQCQEKLGEAEARRSYERVVKEYAGTGPYAAQARARLAAMGGAGSQNGARARVVWDAATDYWGRVSADGRYLSHVDWATGDLAIRDLVKGESRRVTNYGGYGKANGEVESTSLSPDGKRVVFNWQRWDPAAKQEGVFELRTVKADGSDGKTLWKAAKGRYFESYGWTADSKWVAVCEESGGSARIVLLSPNSGETREITTNGKKWKRQLTFSPDGKWLAYEEPVASQARDNNVLVVPVDAAGQMEQQVASGASIQLMGWTPQGDGVIYRRGERLQVISVTNGRAAAEPRALHIPVATGFPQTLGTTAGGTLYYGTSNRSTEALLALVDLEKPFAGEPLRRIPVMGVGLANNHGNLRFSPDGKKLASSASSTTIRIQPVTEGPERILTVPVTELRRFEWMPDGSALVASAVGRDGGIGLYRIDTATGTATYLCPIQRGMVFTLRADGRAVFEFERDGLAEIDLATGNRRLLVARDFSGQGPSNIRRSPDGLRVLLTTYAFLGIYDCATGELRELYRRNGEIGNNVKAADWTADGKQIVAMAFGFNSKEGETWVYRAEGGEPRRISRSLNNQDFAISPDGVHWVVATSKSHSQVWAVENFLPSK